MVYFKETACKREREREKEREPFLTYNTIYRTSYYFKLLTMSRVIVIIKSLAIAIDTNPVTIQVCIQNHYCIIVI